ncbi:ACT domain-containing protein [Pleionea sediminis]|uniref:ACT domain-containing protein n=1 Tax=Pleionea sediminis TaxID=2569479 RepID=UPI001186DB13|nr:ACT domain-containing protein [Pleionea sediminis]
MINNKHQLNLLALDVELVIAKLSAPIDITQCKSELISLSLTNDEISLIAPTEILESFSDIILEKSSYWRALKVNQVLDLNMIGVMSQLSQCLAEHTISLFALSTFNTDYLLVSSSNFQKAIKALETEGHNVETPKASR